LEAPEGAWRHLPHEETTVGCVLPVIVALPNVFGNLEEALLWLRAPMIARDRIRGEAQSPNPAAVLFENMRLAAC